MSSTSTDPQRDASAGGAARGTSGRGLKNVAGKSLPVLALPLIVSFTARFFFAQIDLGFAMWIGDASWVASIGYYQQFQLLFIAIWVGLSGGYTATLSHAFGTQDEERVRSLKRTSMRVLYVLVPILTGLGGVLWLAVPSFGLEPDLESSFRLYGTTMVVGMSLTGFWAIHPDSIVKAHQDTKSTMIAGLMSTGANVVLNFVFVLGFGWGLFGIAMATVVSRFPSLAYASWRMKALENDRLSDPDWDHGPQGAYAPPLRSILALALPGLLTMILTSTEVVLINNLLGGRTVSIAAFGVYNQIAQLALMPTVASAAAVVPFAARLIPRGETERIRGDLKRMFGIAAAFAIVVTVTAGWVFGPTIASAMLGDEVDPDERRRTIELATRIFRLLPLGVLATSPFLLLRPMFEAAQRPNLGIRLSLIRFLGLSAPLVVAGRFVAPMVGLAELTGMIVGMVTATIVASIVAVTMVRRELGRIDERLGDGDASTLTNRA